MLVTYIGCSAFYLFVCLFVAMLLIA